MSQAFEVGLDDVKDVPSKARAKPRARRQGSSYWANGMAGVLRENGDARGTAPIEKKEKNERENEVALVIGIDFGTTYSAAAWGTTADGPDDIKIMKKWPGNEGNEEIRHKVPTAIGTEDEVDGGIDSWGYEITVHMRSFSWFKLLMAQNEHLVAHDDVLLKQTVGQGLLAVPEGYNPEGMCQKYLQRLHDHLLKRAEQYFGKTLLETMPIIYVLTVPADWGGEYKKKLSHAAAAAGIPRRPEDKITFISEPEAAARAAFQSPKHGLHNAALKPNINAVIVDMGGGTVDVITYRILKAQSPIRVSEACAGNSAKCGGTSIDRGLHELMVQKYGTAFSAKGTTEISHGSRFMREFESIKRKFEDGDKPYKLSLSMDLESAPEYDPETRKITLTRDEIRNMFSAVLDPTYQLLEQQMAQSKEDDNNVNVQVVILCGGLSCSNYVQDQVQAFCEERGVEVITPEDSWSAIARGAVLHGMHPRSLVSARRCRQSYGMGVHRQYNPATDANEEDIMNCPIYGTRVKNCIKWHIKKEDTVKNKPARIDAYIVPDKRRRPVGEIKLYKCDSQNPPDRVKGEGVEEFCKLQIDLSGIRGSSSYSRLKHTNRNQKQKIEVKVYQQVLIETNEVEFVAKANRKVVGCRRERYETAEELDDED